MRMHSQRGGPPLVHKRSQTKTAASVHWQPFGLFRASFFTSGDISSGDSVVIQDIRMGCRKTSE
jgi:hypothetical protein